MVAAIIESRVYLDTVQFPAFVLMSSKNYKVRGQSLNKCGYPPSTILDHPQLSPEDQTIHHRNYKTQNSFEI
jgi:hypothetical protein